MRIGFVFIISILIFAMNGCANIHQTQNAELQARRIAANCESGAEVKPLTLVYSKQQLGDYIAPKVHFEIQENVLKVNFRIEMDPSKIYARKKLSSKQYPYQFDVVELFISANGAGTDAYPYYEIQLSPYNQNFQVKIDYKKNRKKFINNQNLHIATRTSINGTGWEGEILLPLESIGWGGDPAKIFGNAFAIIGPEADRTYWSLNMGPQEKPNFHLPKYFRSLVHCP